ncbi:MAG: cyclic pyranopterin monophosphate synthase MoaC [Candidatus Bathyarchaeia archaeon]
MRSISVSSTVRMVDIGEKPVVRRSARVEGFLRLKPETLKAVKEGKVKKGDVFATAELAAITAVKRTPELVLLAHPIPITDVQVDLFLDEARSGVKAAVEVKSIARTGVELEALLGVMACLLNVFDMCKYLEKDARGQYPTTFFTEIRVVEKSKEPIEENESRERE